MSRFIRRSVLVCSLLAILTACQNTAEHTTAPQVDEFAVAELVFAQYLEVKQLGLAGQQLADLRDKYPDELRITDLQQRLAHAWLAVGEQALKEADVNTASAALIEAKRLLPQAPALTEGLDAALLAVQVPREEPSVTPSLAMSKPPAVRKTPVKKQPAVKTEVVPSTEQLGPETEPQTPQPARTPNKVKTRIIDVNTPHTVVPLPMLATRNNHRLGRLLDDVAADVVKFRAAVSIEVADTRDFHWVAALLSARVNKLDGSFKPRLVEVIRSDGPAQLVITPSNI